MVSDAIKHADELQRRDHVPDTHRTRERDRSADWVEEHAADNWNEWTLTELESQTEWSRQHFANVLDHYFEPKSKVDRLADRLEAPDALGEQDRQDILDELTSKEVLIYRMGYRDGMEDAKKLFD